MGSTEDAFQVRGRSCFSMYWITWAAHHRAKNAIRIQALFDSVSDGDRIYFPNRRTYEAPLGGWILRKSLEILGDGPGSAGGYTGTARVDTRWTRHAPDGRRGPLSFPYLGGPHRGEENRMPCNPVDTAARDPHRDQADCGLQGLASVNPAILHHDSWRSLGRRSLPEFLLQRQPQRHDEARDRGEDHPHEEVLVADVILQPATPHAGEHHAHGHEASADRVVRRLMLA